MTTRKTKQEGVLIVCEDDEPVAMVRKNGETLFYKVEKMGFQDVAELLEADKPDIYGGSEKED